MYIYIYTLLLHTYIHTYIHIYIYIYIYIVGLVVTSGVVHARHPWFYGMLLFSND